MDGYDFVIYLEPSSLPRYAQNVLSDESVWMGTLKNANVQSSDTQTIFVGFDPARELLEDLQVWSWYSELLYSNSFQRVYGDTIAFFYDYLGGTAIGCSWNPLVRQAKPFRALLGYTTKPEEGKRASRSVSHDLRNLTFSFRDTLH